MNVQFARFVRREIRKLGLDVTKFPAYGSVAYVLRHCAVDTVLDVGANVGQTGDYLRTMNFDGRIISFEPMAQAYASLSGKCAGDPRWTCHRLAIGGTEGELDLRISTSSVYNSFLPVLAFANQVDSGSRHERDEKVKVRRLNDLWPELRLEGTKVLLKVDTQGYEHSVLEGASEVLDRIVALQLELSIHPIYDGQPSFVEMLNYVRSRGFLIAGMQPGWNDPNTGELLEFDGLFIRRDPPL